MVNEAIAVLINHVESLLELLDLVLVEHGEDVRSRALSALLRARPPGGFPTRHGWLSRKRASATHAAQLNIHTLKKQLKLLIRHFF